MCDDCLCDECNENILNEKGGQCNLCNICTAGDDAKTICPINKYHDDYGDGQGK